MTGACQRLAAIRRSDTNSPAWDRLEALAVDMDASGRERDSPVRETFALLGDRWTMLILLALGAGEWRHGALRRIIGALAAEGAISQRMLTLKLRALERNGYVQRNVSDDSPPQVSYGLTENGRGLLAQAAQLLQWVNEHRATIIRARLRFDAVPADG